MSLLAMFVVRDGGSFTWASTTHGSSRQVGHGGSCSSLRSSHSKDGDASSWCDPGSSVKHSIVKSSRIREYSQAASSQTQPAEWTRSGLVSQSVYLMASNIDP